MPSKSISAVLGTQTRAAAAPVTVDAAARTFECVWSTGAAVRRFDWERWREFDEILDLDGADLSRLDGAPFLDAHNSCETAAVIGVVERAWIEERDGQQVGIALIRMADTASVEETWAKIEQGILRQVSVGYQVKIYEERLIDGAIPQLIAREWVPIEISLVPVGADAGAVLRSATAEGAPVTVQLAAEPEPEPEPEPQPEPEPEPNPEPQPDPNPEPQVEERAAPAEIVRRCVAAGCADVAAELIERGATAQVVEARIAQVGVVRGLVDRARSLCRSINDEQAARVLALGEQQARAALFDLLIAGSGEPTDNKFAPGNAGTRAASSNLDPAQVYAARRGGKKE